MSNEPGCQCGQSHGACTTEFQYAVKLVCGVVVAPAGGAPTPVAPGRYWTAINIHNPDKCHEARFRWKVAVAEPGKAGPVSKYRTLILGPDMALEIDCPQVAQTFPPPPPAFVKGYVVIESDIELDVVAVYSGTQGTNTLLSSFHTERVQPRCVPVCEDLILPLHTGFADWQTVAPTPGQLGPVVQVIANWGVPAPFLSTWVGQFSTDGLPSTSAGLRHYELCFDLCFGFEIPSPGTFPIQVLVDDSATVQLINTAGTTTLNPNVLAYTLTTINVLGTSLRAGRNCIRVTVNNVGGPTAFALAGILRAIRGKCPCSPLPIAAKSLGPTPLEAPSAEPSARV